MSSPRPTQVTVAGWLVVVGSVTAIVTAFSEVASLRTLDTRNAVKEYLSKPPGSSVGLNVDDVLTMLRVASTVTAACAAATAVLGWYALRRSRGSRAALSFLAVPLLVAGLLSGGALVGVVVVAIVMLWLQPARAWYDGLPAPAPVPPRAPTPPTRAAPSPDRWQDLPPPTTAPVALAAPVLAPAPSASDPGPRPGTMVSACLVTWVATSLISLLLLLTSIVMLAEPHALLDAAHRQNPDLASQGVTDTALETTVYVMTGVVVLWSVAAAVLAVLAWRRVHWAALALVASTVAAGALCMVMVVGSVVMLVPALACVATLVLLLRPESRRWYG